MNYVTAEPEGHVVVVGDLHGQLHDLLFILKERGILAVDEIRLQRRHSRTA